MRLFNQGKQQLILTKHAIVVGKRVPLEITLLCYL